LFFEDIFVGTRENDIRIKALVAKIKEQANVLSENGITLEEAGFKGRGFRRDEPIYGFSNQYQKDYNEKHKMDANIAPLSTEGFNVKDAQAKEEEVASEEDKEESESESDEEEEQELFWDPFADEPAHINPEQEEIDRKIAKPAIKQTISELNAAFKDLSVITKKTEGQLIEELIKFQVQEKEKIAAAKEQITNIVRTLYLAGCSPENIQALLDDKLKISSISLKNNLDKKAENGINQLKVLYKQLPNQVVETIKLQGDPNTRRLVEESFKEHTEIQSAFDALKILKTSNPNLKQEDVREMIDNFKLSSFGNAAAATKMQALSMGDRIALRALSSLESPYIETALEHAKIDPKETGAKEVKAGGTDEKPTLMFNKLPRAAPFTPSEHLPKPNISAEETPPEKPDRNKPAG
jgi:hypothetical protein